MSKRFAVIFREYERGWGSKDFHAVLCSTLEEAEKLEREEDAKNTSSVAPDYYIQARVVIVTEENRGDIERLC